MSQDIRLRFDIKGPESRVAANILRRRYPHPEEGPESPGFDCLVVVLRSIYSYFMVGDVTSFDWMDAAEKENPILAHAWLVFGHELKDLEETASDRKRVISSVNVPGVSFEETGQKVDISSDELACASLLELDLARNPDMTLEGMIKNSFGVISFKGQEVLWRPSRPCIVRVLYTPNVCSSRGLDINDLRALYLPISEQDPNEVNLCSRDVEKQEYYLQAVVRLKDDQHSQEYVRTYNPHGANILPEREPKSFVDHSWSVKDTPGRYMLFYGMKTIEDLGDPTRFTEVARPLLSESDVEVLKLLEKELREGPAKNVEATV